VFFGSAYTELAYNIRTLINTYPYQTLLADLVSSFTNITLTNDFINNTTDIIFTSSTVKDQGNFLFFDDNPNFSILNYDILDKNDKRYSISNFIAPYSANNIYNISNIQNGIDGIRITTSIPHTYQNGDKIEIYEVIGSLLSGETSINVNYNELNVVRFQITNVTSNTFELLDYLTGDGTIMNFTYTSGGKVRKYPLTNNTGNLKYKITINGILTFNEFITYTDANNNGNLGILISPKQNILNDFQLNLTPIQKFLLSPSPINQTPWPTRLVTGNLQNRIDLNNPSNTDQDFLNWLKDPDLLYNNDGSQNDTDYAFGPSPLFTEFNILRAQALDETYSNQLIRRAIPPDIISELNDPYQAYFQRFILIAGWFFDQVYVYIKFLKYVHSINYGKFNQLSPEYYKYYASYYGFDLFTDDSIDFSKLVVQTEPGLTYLQQNVDINNKYYQSTLQSFQNEREKRLLLSLLYLYKVKGTQDCISKLVSLLGAPDGLLQLQEYAFKYTNTNNLDYVINNDYSQIKRIVDNTKVHVPDFHFEIDPYYLIDKTNIDNTINKPYVYRMRLHNESTVNLREIGIMTDPNKAIDTHIEQVFGNIKYNYVKFNNGEFANLQNLSNKYYYLPLSLPDKFAGFSVEYLIPRDGFIKGIANNLEEVSCHICSLFLVDSPIFKPTANVSNLEIQNSGNTLFVTTGSIHNFIQGEKIEFFNVNGINNVNGISFLISSVPSPTTFTITGTFTGTYINGGVIKSTVPFTVNSGFNRSYFLPEVYSNYNDDTYLSGSTNPITDFNILNRVYPSSTFLDISSMQYIIARLEGKDIVIRLKLVSEINGSIVERVAILQNIFDNDGLNHNLRFITRAEGIEIYLDYQYIGLAQWRDPSTNSLGIPFLAIEIPKKNILSCSFLEININDLVAFPNKLSPDNIKWWDLFIGYPQNIDLYFKKVEIFQNIGIDSFNIGDKILNSLNYNVDSYIFDFTNTQSNNTEFTTYCEFEKSNPSILSQTDYSYLLPNTTFNNNTVVSNLTLTSKTLTGISYQKNFPNKIQDFFSYPEGTFTNFAWKSTLHSDYEYDNFSGKVINLYNLNSPQVLTYQDLASFLDLIENKFQQTIKQFIPIVINISEFGRLIENSNYSLSKVRYTGTFKTCIGGTKESPAFVQTKFYLPFNGQGDNITPGNNVIMQIISPAHGVLLGPITVNWDTDLDTTQTNIVEAFNNQGINSYSPNIFATILNRTIRIEIVYHWYLSTFSENPNLLQFQFTDNINTFTIPFANGIAESSSDCFTIKRIPPQLTNLDQVYVYYDSENQDNPYIYYNLEGQDPTYI